MAELAPHSVEAEQALLGSVLISPAVYELIRGQIRADDLFLLKHQAIYRAMQDLHDAGVGIDLLTLADRLESVDKLTSVGGPAYLAGLVNAVPTATNAVFYAQLINAAARRRDLLKRLDTIRLAAMDESQPIGAVASLFSQEHKAWGDSLRVERPEVSFTEAVEAHYNRQTEIAERRRAGVSDPVQDVYSLPLIAVENVMGPLRAGSLVITAGRPGAGKSSLLHAQAVHSARRVRGGKRVLLFSREMPLEQVTDVMIAQQGRIRLNDIIDGTMDAETWRKYDRITAELHDLPLDIDAKTPDWESMVDIIQARAREGSLCMVLFDYLRLIQTRRTFKGDSAVRLRFEYILAEAKQLALSTGAVFVFAAQVNREGAGAPTLQNLKDSGATEEDSDVVIVVHPEATDTPERTEVLQPYDVLILKNRHGPKGRVKAGFLGGYKLFVDVAAPRHERQAVHRGPKHDA